MAFQKKIYFTLLVGRVIGLHCRCSKISGNILKDFGKVDTLLLKLVNRRGLNNLDKTAYGAESPSNYLLSVSKCMLLQIYRSFILFTYLSLNVIPYCSGRCQDKWEKSRISSPFLFPQLCLFYLQLLVSIIVLGKKYLEVHQQLSHIHFQLAVYQHHAVPSFYTIIKIHTAC